MSWVDVPAFQGIGFGYTKQGDPGDRLHRGRRDAEDGSCWSQILRGSMLRVAKTLSEFDEAMESPKLAE